MGSTFHNKKTNPYLPVIDNNNNNHHSPVVREQSGIGSDATDMIRTSNKSTITTTIHSNQNHVLMNTEFNTTCTTELHNNSTDKMNSTRTCTMNYSDDRIDNNNNNNNNNNTLTAMYDDDDDDRRSRSRSTTMATTTTATTATTTYISIDDAIERIGYGAFQRTMMIATGLCFASDSIQIMLISFLTIQIQQEWVDDNSNNSNTNNNSDTTIITENRKASLTAAVFAGAFCGTLILGPLADSIGRRYIFLGSAAIIFIFSFFGIAILTPKNGYYTLLVMIFGLGLGIGGLTVPFDIFAECLPPHDRGKQLLFIEYFWSMGGLFVVVIAYFVIESNWRYFVAICSIPSLLSFIVGYMYVPESPRWLSSIGQTDKAIRILKYAALQNGFTQHDIDENIFPSTVQLKKQRTIPDSTLSDLFLPKWRCLIFRLWGTWFAMAFGYYGAILAVTRVFHENTATNNNENVRSTGTANYESNSASHPIKFDYSAIFVSNSAEIVATTFVILAVDRIGRIPTQVISFTGGGICVCFLTILAGNYNNTNRYHWVLVGLGFLTRLFEMAGSCVTWVMTVEVLPTNIRGTGHSTANAIARVGAFLCPFVVDKLQLSTVGWVMLLVHVVTVSCVCTLPETTGTQLGGFDNNEFETESSNINDGDDDNDHDDDDGYIEDGNEGTNHHRVDQTNSTSEIHFTRIETVDVQHDDESRII